MMSDKLIDIVKMYPILYDMSSKNSAKKYEAWKEVAEKLGYQNGAIAKAKWRNIRDSYVKYLKAKNGELDHNHYLVKKYVKWPWAEHMKFIEPYVNITAFKSENVKSYASNESDLGELSDNNNELHEEITVNDDPLNVNEIKTEPDEESNIEISGLSENKTVTVKNLDPLDLLFLSYAQTLKTFPKKKQIELKMQISVILSTAELEMAEQPH